MSAPHFASALTRSFQAAGQREKQSAHVPQDAQKCAALFPDAAPVRARLGVATRRRGRGKPLQPRRRFTIGHTRAIFQSRQKESVRHGRSLS